MCRGRQRGDILKKSSVAGFGRAAHIRGVTGADKKTVLAVSKMGPGSFQRMKTSAPKSSAASQWVFRYFTSWTITRGTD